MNFSSVVSWHRNPLTCGVAKFSFELAKRMGVPCVGWNEPWGDFPLLSLKASEIPGDTVWRSPPRFGVFAHDDIGDLARDAAVVFYADPSLGKPGLWCPSLITPRNHPVRLFSFGMAHKLQTEQYRTVQRLLAAAKRTHTLRVSVGLHEGTTLDGAEKHFEALKDIMGESQVTILGCLSDDAVSEELSNADHVLAFFEHGLRANNTTVHAALEAGAHVITNHDAFTPSPLRYMTTDIGRLTTWPQRHGTFGDLYSWERLIATMEALCGHSRSQIA